MKPGKLKTELLSACETEANMRTLQQSLRGQLGRVAAFVMMLCACAHVAVAQVAGASHAEDLIPGRTLERELAGAETQIYKLDLKTGEFFQARVEQKGVDVTLRLRDADGNVLATMDSPNSTQGPETLSFVAARAGSFALEVSALDAKAAKGGYSIHREESRAATANDRRRVEVERLFVEGLTEVGAGDRTEAALKKLSAAQAGWRELADGYMADMTARQVAAVTLQELNKTQKAAQTLLGEGQKLTAKSKSDSSAAIAKLNEALTMYRDLNVKLDDKSLLELVRQADDASKREQTLLESLRFYSKAGEALSLNAIAQAYWNIGEYRENVNYLELCVAAYEDAIKILDADAFGPIRKQYQLSLKGSVAGALSSIGGTLNTRLGKPEEALKYLSRALEQFHALYQESQDASLKLEEAMTLQQMGSAYLSASKERSKGIEYLSKSAEIFRAFPDKQSIVANLLSLIGSQYSLDFDYEEALKSYDAALEIYRSTNDKAGQADLLQFKAAMYYILDDQPKVRETLNQALVILQSPDYVESFKRSLGRPAEGFEVFGELGDALFEQVRLDRIGYSYLLLGDYEKAIEYYEKSLAVARAQKDPASIQGELESIGFTYTKLEKWDKARECYVQALEISRAGTAQEKTADDLADVGWTLLEAGRPQEALKFQNEALAILQAAGVDVTNAFSTRYSTLLNEVARTHAALGNRRMAIFYGKLGVNAIQDERRRLRRTFDAEAQKGFIGKKEKHYRRLAEWLISEGRIPEAEQVLSMLKEEETFSYLRRDDNATSNLQQTATLDAKEGEALKRYGQLADKLTAVGAEYGQLYEESRRPVYANQEFPKQARLKELKEELDAANVAFEKYLDELKVRFGEKDERVAQVDSGLRNTLKRLKASRTIAVSTIVGEDRLNIIVTTSETQRAHTVDITESEVNRLVADFRQAVTNPNVDPRPSGQKLYDVLVKPIEADLEGVKADTILWSLDGTLRYVPVSALWDSEKGYLVERFASGVLTLASRDTLALPVPDRREWRALGVGVSKAAEGFAALSAVPDELDCIITDSETKTVSPKPVCQSGVMTGRKLLDEKFTLEAFENSLGRFPIVHIASHFSLNPGNDKDSFLLLGGGAQRRFTVNDLRGVELTDVELLVLSACNTATPGGEKTNGVEIEGFGALAQKQGSHAVMATLWSVADDSTRELMVRFYELYKKGELSKAEALRQAELSLMTGGGKAAEGSTRRGIQIRPSSVADKTQPKFERDAKAPYAHPFYWSPFVLFGNWR